MFDEREIQLMMDGLDALIKYEEMSDSMGSLIGAIVLNKEEDRANYAAKQEVIRDAKQAEWRTLNERTILIKAKLIGLKDKAIAESIYGADQ